MGVLQVALVAMALVGSLTSLPAHAQHAGDGLPEGRAKELVASVCTGCHQTSEILRSSGYTAEGWKELTGTMVDLSASPAEQERIVDYLATQFPPNTKRAPMRVPGDAQIAFREWQVPTLGQRS